MKPRSVLFLAMLALAAATAFAAGEPPAGAGQAEAAGKSGVEKLPGSGGRLEDEDNAPAAGVHVVNYEELPGCKPMEGADGCDHAKRRAP